MGWLRTAELYIDFLRTYNFNPPTHALLELEQDEDENFKTSNEQGDPHSRNHFKKKNSPKQTEAYRVELFSVKYGFCSACLSVVFFVCYRLKESFHFLERKSF